MNKQEQTKDMVNNPPHYKSGNVECIDAIESALSTEEFLGYLRGTVIKYMYRSNKKGDEMQDIEKAEWFINRLKKELKIIKGIK